MKKYVQENLLHTLLQFMKWSTITMAFIFTTAFTALAKPATGQSVLQKKVTVNIKEQFLGKALEQISSAAAVKFTYGGIISKSNVKVSTTATDLELKIVLDKLFKDQPYSYEVVGDEVLIRYDPQKNKVKEKPVITPERDQGASIIGKVVDEKDIPLTGVTITLKGTQIVTVSDANGFFTIQTLKNDATLIFSYVGYKTRELQVSGQHNLTIKMEQDFGKLDQVQVIGYGVTTKRLSTGNVSTIKSDVIASQPVTNPMQALEGRVAGLVVTQTNGLPGASMSVQIRGQNSIFSGNQPLYVIDGVPFAAQSLDQVLGANAPAYGGISPLNSINPSDIQSIEILKDADETAIYGSRGANGVILITTKSGKQGKTRLDVNVNSGAGAVTRLLPMLNPQQYYDLREQAFANDGVTPTINNAPDLLVWDKSKTTDFEKLLIGNTAHQFDATASISGGDATTTYLISGAYHHETTVFPGNLGYDRGGVHINLDHHSSDKKFKISFSASYTGDNNKLNSTDLTPSYNLPPDYPLYTASGQLNWEGGINNPLAFLAQPYTSQTANLISNSIIQYEVLPGLNLKANMGFNKLSLDQVALYPASSQNPAYNPTGTSTFVSNYSQTYIVEPQAEYKHDFGKLTLTTLLGSTFQQTSGKLYYIYGYNYSSDALLGSATAAGGIYVSNYSSLYKYDSVFGRVNLNWDNKYILNGNYRRDGSSRFGPGKQFGNFGSIGGAWIFSEENVIKDKISFLSLGKLRASYGTVGNDQIGDYGYLSSYNSTYYPYGGSAGLYPYNLNNADYSWEVTKKIEAGLDLGFFKDRILLSAAWYRNRSGNQLIGIVLPSQTGFNFYDANLPAVVQNTGLEFEINTVNLKGKDISWSTSFNITIPKNKLVAYPGLLASGQGNYYVVGNPVQEFAAYHFTGLNPQTGIPSVADINNDGVIGAGLAANGLGDKVIAAKLYPDLYGGLSNRISYKNWELSFFFQFVKQQGRSVLSRTSNPPGTMQNMPAAVSGRWQHPGDVTNIPAATTTPGTAAYNAYNYYYQSDATESDGSFIRLKNLSLSYNFSGTWLQRYKIQHLRLYVQGQNLLTFTHYLGFDPENSAVNGIPILPPLKVLTAGIQCSL